MSDEAVDSAVVIRRVRDPFGYLGNMSPHPVSYHGAGGVFATAEALFQALRFPRDSQTHEEIRMARSPMAAKMIAKKEIVRMHVVPRSALTALLPSWQPNEYQREALSRFPDGLDSKDVALYPHKPYTPAQGSA